MRPNNAVDPGLVFDSGWNDWLGFLCGTQLPTSFCTGSGIPVLDPSNFNGASIAIADLAGTQTVQRTVTNVGSQAETYIASYTGLAGITVGLPGAITVAKGAKQTFNVTFSAATATLNAYVGGQFTLTGNMGYVVRIPVVLRPVPLGAPAEVSGTGDAINYSVSFGYTGPFTATARGLMPAMTFDGPINTGQQLSYNVTVPSGATYARFSLFDVNVKPASDLDLVVYFNSNVVGSSGGGSSAEEVNLRNPAAGTYTVVVDGYATANPSTFTLFAWALGSAAAGNMTVSAPASATLNTTSPVNLTFTGLAPRTKYLGSVAYTGTANLPNPTIARVDAP